MTTPATALPDPARRPARLVPRLREAHGTDPLGLVRLVDGAAHLLLAEPAAAARDRGERLYARHRDTCRGRASA